MERFAIRRQDLHRHDCCARHRDPRLRSDSSEQQKYCRVHLLSRHRDSGFAPEGKPSRHHGDPVGKLSVHSDRRAGTELLRNPYSGRGLDGRPVPVPRSSERDSGHIQCLRRIDFNRPGLPRLPRPHDEPDDCQPSAVVGSGSMCLFHRQRGQHCGHHLPDGGSAVAEHPGRLLFLVVPLLSRRRWNRRRDRLAEPHLQLGDLTASGPRSLCNLPLLPPVPRQT